MKTLKLVRFAYAPVGTFGYAQSEAGVLYSVERPWLSNAHGVSCIPEGSYECRPTYFHKGGYDAFEVQNVPQRSGILIHIANFPTDVEGCIGLGKKLGTIMGQWAVLESDIGFKAFMLEFGSTPFTLDITQIKGASL